ncbi:homocysteine S-methyltransferase family protein [Selenomonas artemidis]|uniref:homocysteine S-methyltransferase family protein n=1 Tax=Selenomonas artemidis TaxID=671224 RepID=UPI00040B0BA4|nr:homocysteine S-methyltransferase family protein [Selenomonas artemidis]
MQDIIILDGGMGTELQARGLAPGERPELFGMEHPEVIEEVHRNYIAAGSRVIYSNTFGANGHKLIGTGKTVAEVIGANVAIARRAAENSGVPGVRVALDIGPIGELVEPLGTLSFEDAYELFREMVTAGEAAGADLVIFETLTDLYEVKAAVLAAKEHTKLPIWVTMTFEQNGRTFLGAAVPSVAVTLDALGVAALGVNCSLGPVELLPIVAQMMEWTDLPIIVKPNAGLPDPRTGAYEMAAEEFGTEMAEFARRGAVIMGGCCGTNPDFIRALAAAVAGGAEERPKRKKRKGVASPGCVAEYGKLNVIGERINPTGKKRLQQALLEEDMGYIKKLAISQQEAGANVLDINVGAQGVDEEAIIPRVVKAVQSVVDLPLQIDSANPKVIEAALRVTNGRVIINSVSGERARMDEIFPLAKHYGAAVLGLALDESGLPQTAAERVAIAERIIEEAERYGLDREDIIIDCLTLTVSAQQEQAMETLRAVREVHDRLGLHCALGVSNISFGLPARVHMTENFLIQAMHVGLDFPIVNPNTKEIMDAVVSYRAVSGEDVDCAAYITRFAPEQAEMRRRKELGLTGDTGVDAAVQTAVEQAGDVDPLMDAIMRGLSDDAERITRKLLTEMAPMDIIQEKVIPALDIVGDRYEKEIIFLPQLINAANAATAGLELIKVKLAEAGQGVSKGKIILATVEGDIHDIGKNIVKVVLENYGYQIIDLGRDVPVTRVVEVAIEKKVGLIGLSALMTTTVTAMKRTIEALREAGHDCHTVVGGAVLTEDYAREIGADYYAGDARSIVEIARRVLDEQED